MTTAHMLDTNEAEWQAIEAASFRDARGLYYPHGHIFEGLKASTKPHPQSYGADLPLRGVGYLGYGSTQSASNALTKTTKAERAILAARQLTLHMPSGIHAQTDAHTAPNDDHRKSYWAHADWKQAVEWDKERTAILKRREGVRARAVELSLVILEG